MDVRVWEKKQQVIELDNTQVHGNIIFEQNDGQVILKNGAKVSGKIIGGSVQK